MAYERPLGGGVHRISSEKLTATCNDPDAATMIAAQ